MLNNSLLTILLAFSIFHVRAQNSGCFSDEMHQNLLKASETYKNDFKQRQVAWNNQISNLSRAAQYTATGDTIYEIPCVVHVIHTGNAIGGLYNPSATDIQAMIDKCNQILSATESTFPTVGNGGVDMKVRIRLADRDENCQLSSGIDRIDGTVYNQYSSYGMKINNSQGVSELNIKNLSRMNPEHYYNIWIVNKIDGFDGYSASGIAGFAYFPGAPTNLDGVVILSAFADGNASNATLLVHELGHMMGLYHTFEGDNAGSSCPIETNCALQNDQICDTDPHIRDFNCPTGSNTCTGNSLVPVTYNHMNYSSCPNRFTSDQRDKALFELENFRTNLIHSITADTVITSSPIAATCSTTTSLSTNNGIQRVRLAGIDYSSSGYTGDGFLSYIDRTCYSGTSLTHGSTYTLNVQSTGSTESAVAYIDYNNDGIFASAEQIMNSSSGPSHAAVFTVPSSAYILSPIRMRVVSSAAAPTVCGTLNTGQSEDYSISISPDNSSSSLSSNNIELSAVWDYDIDRPLLRWSCHEKFHEYSIFRASDTEERSKVYSLEYQGQNKQEWYDPNATKDKTYLYSIAASSTDEEKWSNTVEVRASNNNTPFRIFPNPAKDQVNIHYTSPSDELIDIRIVDIIGRQVLRLESKADPSTHLLQIDVSLLKSGLYTLQLSNSSSKIIQHFKFLIE